MPLGRHKTFPSWERSELRLERDGGGDKQPGRAHPGDWPAPRTRTGRELNGQDVRTQASGSRDCAFLSSSQRTDHGILLETALRQPTRTWKWLAGDHCENETAFTSSCLLPFVCSVGWLVGRVLSESLLWKHCI